MLRRGNIGTVLGLGALAELLVFIVVAERMGFGSAVLLTFAMSLLGMIMLRRSGASALSSLKAMAGATPALTRESALLDGVLGAVGAVLLIVPGFLTDLVGLALLAPSGRQWLVRRLGGSEIGPGTSRASPQSGTIDLGAGDWTRLDNLRSP